MSRSNVKKVEIIGAGVAGLTSAALLQSRGFDVTLVDRNPLPGGKLNRIEDRGYTFDTGPSLVTMPDHERTPLDFRERTWADRGSLYGRAPDSLLAMMRRPINREPGCDGVTFAGGTTHPGAGIPLAALSGKLAADLICGEVTI